MKSIGQTGMVAWIKLAGALGVLTVVALCAGHLPLLPYLFDRLASGVAGATAAMLSGLGTHAVFEGTSVFHRDGFRYVIDHSCTGIVPAAFLSVAILFFPTAKEEKWRGFCQALLYVFAVNQIRLISLFYIGVRHPEWFTFIHEVLWEGLMIILVGGFWLSWIGRLKLQGIQGIQGNVRFDNL